ncbi:hypothetical protein HGG75_27760 [Ochrobactrum pseudogrignonense]|nr:hypothetical protein [Brucella pseudogrignonensis]
MTASEVVDSNETTELTRSRQTSVGGHNVAERSRFGDFKDQTVSQMSTFDQLTINQ